MDSARTQTIWRKNSWKSSKLDNCKSTDARISTNSKKKHKITILMHTKSNFSKPMLTKVRDKGLVTCEETKRITAYLSETMWENGQVTYLYTERKMVSTQKSITT